MNREAMIEIGRNLVPIVAKQIQEAMAPIFQRLDTLEARPVSRSIQGAMKNEAGVLFLMLNDGSTIDTGIRDGATPPVPDVRGLIAEEVGRAIPPPPDVKALLDAAVAELPPPRDGRPPDPDEVLQVAIVAVDRALASPEGQAILREVARQESQPGPIGPPGPAGPPGRDADPDYADRLVADAVEKIRSDAAALVEKLVSELPPPAPGQTGPAGPQGPEVDSALVRQLVEEVVGRVDVKGMIYAAVAELPAPAAGPPGRDADPEHVAQLVTAAVDKHRIDIEGMVDEAVKLNLARVLASLPAPRDGAPGKDADMDAVLRHVSAEVARAAAAIPPGKDGVGIAGAIIDRDGNLVVTTTDGRAHNLGPVVGRDGKEGPAGRDGLGFEDMSVELKDKALVVTFKRGADVKEFTLVLPFLRYRGVWKQGEAYEAGDVVTWAGSAFVATRDTVGKPEVSDDWQLAVKRGRDGKDGKDGKEGQAGPKGERGRDLTQLGADGSKW